MTTRPDFDRVIDRRGTESFKWRIYPPDVLPLFVADMDFAAPEPVQRALRGYVEAGIDGYPRGLYTDDVAEVPELVQVVVERMARRYQWQITPQDVIAIPGVVPALSVACHVVVSADPGSVLVQPPGYPPILGAPSTAGLRRLEAPLERTDDGAYRIDRKEFEAAFAADTRLFILCNPHNPVGRVYRRDELEGIAEACLSRNVVICSDEIHSDLLFEGHRHIPIASLSREVADRTITLIAPSKTFNLAGLQCAFAIIENPELRRQFQAARRGLMPWVGAVGLIAAEAAYREADPWLRDLLVYLEANRDFVREFIGREMPQLQMTTPEGTYLAWIDCSRAGLDNPYRFFLDQARVALNDGPSFGTGGTGFVRLNFACPRSVLGNALHRMRVALSARTS